MRIINLLPESEVKELKLELASRHFMSFFVVVAISLVVLIVGAFCAKILIGAEISVNDEQISELQSQLNTSDNQALQKEIVALNAQIKNIKSISQDHYYWSVALIELGNLVPADIHFDTASFDRASGQVVVTGTADQRGSVLTFWSNVKKSKVFTNINFPLTNLEKPTDTPFTFSFSVIPSALKLTP